MTEAPKEGCAFGSVPPSFSSVYANDIRPSLLRQGIDVVAWEVEVEVEVEVELLLVDLMLLGGWNVQVFQRLSCFRLSSSFAVLMLSRSVPFLASCSFCFARNGRM